MTNSAILKEMEAAAATFGLNWIAKSSTHFQISETVLVNYWPFSPRRTAHVQGAVNSVQHVTPAEAVAMAMKPLAPKDTGRNYGRKKGEARDSVARAEHRDRMAKLNKEAAESALPTTTVSVVPPWE